MQCKSANIGEPQMLTWTGLSVLFYLSFWFQFTDDGELQI